MLLFTTIVKAMDGIHEQVQDSAPSPCAFEVAEVLQQAEEDEFPSRSRLHAKEVCVRSTL